MVYERTAFRCYAGWTFSKMGIIKLGPPPTLRFLVTRLLPIVLSSAGALYFGNVAYLSLSVAFIQILKVWNDYSACILCKNEFVSVQSSAQRLSQGFEKANVGHRC